MRIDCVLWNSHSVAHIARHEVTPEEVDGRRLVVVIAPRPRNNWYVVTARDVDRAERRRMKR